MQSNTLTITPSTGTGALACTRHSEDTNRSTYIFDATHSTDVRDQFQLYRTFSKRSGNSRGSRKCAIKFTHDISVDNADGSGTIVLPLIGEVSFSIPEGATAAEISSLQGKLCGVLTGSADYGARESTNLVADLYAVLEI